MYAIDDAVYLEVGDIVAQVTGGSKGTWQNADKLKRIFGPIACDRSPERFAFDMRRLPRCPECREFFLKFDRYAEPVVVVDVAVTSVSHSEWEQCSLEEKNLRVAAALQENGST